MIVTIVAAVAADLCIGRGGDLPWRLKDDLRRFRETTSGAPVIMGRKTWDSLPRRPLPNRTNVVMSRRGEPLEGALAARCLAGALEVARLTGAPEAFVIGGGEIYAQAMPYAHRMLLTRVEATVPGGDAFFPAWDEREWVTASVEPAPPSAPAAYYHTLLRAR